MSKQVVYGLLQGKQDVSACSELLPLGCPMGQRDSQGQSRLGSSSDCDLCSSAKHG